MSTERASAQGGTGASPELFAMAYAELRRLAAVALRRERPEHTLQPTALVHEAFMRLAGVDDARWNDRDHFIAAAARVMRRVLVDHARSREALKRGEGDSVLPLEDIDVPAATTAIDLTALDDILERLATLDPRQARIVELRFFGGLTVEETAALVGTSPRTVKREWQMARAWLARELSSSRSGATLDPRHPASS